MYGVADRAFSVTKKSAGGILSNPLNMLNTCISSALNCLV